MRTFFSLNKSSPTRRERFGCSCKRLAVWAILSFAGLQLARTPLTNPPVTSEAVVPADVAATLRRACYDCHSNETNVRWFDQLVPAQWLVAKDILGGRARLNFSEAGTLPASAQRASLFESVNQVHLGAMPPALYLLLHPSARIDGAQLARWERALEGPTENPGVPVERSLRRLQPTVGVRPAPNGTPFPRDYADWTPISATNRFDNHTIRLILGNARAMQAIARRRISPWPDGAALVKVAWSVEAAEPSRPTQVELMIKDARGHASTEGWAFARWRGDALVPYGKDASFVDECTGCHAPMRDDDFVYTMPIGHGDGADAWNDAATVANGVPVAWCDWRAIRVSVGIPTGDIALTLGNDVAVEHARLDAPGDYPVGAVLARVTWHEEEDRHWFGGRIPGAPRSFEVVTVSADDKAKGVYAYDSFDPRSAERTTPRDASVVALSIHSVTAVTPGMLSR